MSVPSKKIHFNSFLEQNLFCIIRPQINIEWLHYAQTFGELNSKERCFNKLLRNYT